MHVVGNPPCLLRIPRKQRQRPLDMVRVGLPELLPESHLTLRMTHGQVLFYPTLGTTISPASGVESEPVSDSGSGPFFFFATPTVDRTVS